jgi:glycosyltransferase involved in cell wall biosynthesis
MAPPLPLVALAWVVSKLLRSRLIIDAHTGVFNDPKWAWTLGAFMWFARRSTATIVTNRQLVNRLERAGVKAISLHDPPIPSASKRSNDVASDWSSKESVIVPCSFSSDEPIAAIIDAAKELPSVNFYITGPLPQRLSHSAIKVPTNVVLTGFLPHTEYQDLLRSARLVLALTTRELTMQRAGYEALSSHKPLLTSDTQVLREYFTEGAVFTLPYADDIRAGVLRCLENQDSLAKGMASLHRQKLAEWDSELSNVKRYLEHLP